MNTTRKRRVGLGTLASSIVTVLAADLLLLTVADASQLTNTSQLSVFVMANCLNGYFHDPLLESLGESLVTAGNGGAVAALSSSNMTGPISQQLLVEAFYSSLFASPQPTVGDALVTAKATVGSKIGRTWIFLGDPVTRVR